ncbi:AimR family lysis-lysogeny pheromone receptor, partial [Bacillus paranthracis]|nr:AimR family lysis-lysogeny pheromone receptor [Bacillus paranthracis]
MRDLMKELNNTIQSMNMSVRKIAKEINVSRTTISNGLDLKTGEMKFDVYEKLVHHVYKDPLKQIKMIRSFIEKCSTSMNVRKALSYSQVAGEYKVIESLIKRYS